MPNKAPWELEKTARAEIAEAGVTGDARDIARALEAVLEYAKRIYDMRDPPAGLR